MKPLVSAIVSTYNSEQFIEGKILDLLKQTIKNRLEIIIVNSGSLQDEDSIVNKYLNKYDNIKYIKTEERETIYKAWNRGIKIASGEYITNANTDDRLKDDAFEIFVRYMGKRPQVALTYADQYISNVPNQNFNEIKNGMRTYRPSYSNLKLFSGYMAGSQSLWRRSLHFKDDIWFDEKYEVAGDYDFICRVAEKYDIKKIKIILGVYYKSKSKTNKEDQNLEQTYSEAAAVKDCYGRRFINILPESQLDKLQFRLKWLVFMPGYFYGLINRFSGKYLPGYFIPDKIFFCWVLSLIYERKKEFELSRKIIEPYQHRDISGVVIKQMENLSDKIGKQS